MRPTKNTLDPARLPELLTVNEYAQIARITPATVRSRLRDGQIKGCKLGVKLWRIPREEVTSLLEGGAARA